MKTLRSITTFSLLLISTLSFAQNTKTRLTTGWDFVKGDIASPWEAFRPETQSKLPVWENIQMPHCFNAFDAVDPDIAYYEGPGWYRTKLKIENPYTNGRTILHFEGAGQKTEVYVFTKKVGSHVGGYDEFWVDITDAVKNYLETKTDTSSLIPIAVRCDNSRDAEMIPSDLSDFNVYGGLYRYVNLEYQPEVSLKRVDVQYNLSEDLKKAEIQLDGLMQSSTENPKEISIEWVLKNANSKVIQTKNETITSWKGVRNFAKFSLNKPQLWNTDAPYLYELEVSVTYNGESQKVNQHIGFRSFEFVTHGPFKLNNERLLLRGTHRHEDHAGVAAAMTESLMRQEMLLMKKMGVNFIRLGHYQQSRIILNLCDSLGILVWEEIPWCRGGVGGEVYRAQARRMLTHMIEQHHNHPSIIIWGLGNENDWPGDFETFDKDEIRAFMAELNDLAHQLDATRKTAIRRCDFCKDIVDVYSPSIWAGWYRGKYTDYQEVSKMEADQVNHFLHVEWGASNHAGRHSETPDQGLSQIKSSGGADERSGDFLMSGGDARVSKDGDWSETYACNLIDWHLKEQENMDWLTGTAYWPFKDFSTPLRPENPVPYVNQKGVVQRDLRPKEAFYVFQSYWIKEPMAHIYGHTWETRWGTANETKMVKVYSNCSEAELFLNGKSLGVRKRNSQDFPAAGLRWTTPFVEGKNDLRVVATSGKTKVTDEVTFTYQIQNWTAPTTLQLKEIERNADTVLIEARVFDSNGTFCPDAKNLVAFSIAGDGILLDNLGTSDGSRKIQLYNGKARIKIKLEGLKAVAAVSSEALHSAFVELNK